jgi:hypothetical protein
MTIFSVVFFLLYILVAGACLHSFGRFRDPWYRDIAVSLGLGIAYQVCLGGVLLLLGFFTMVNHLLVLGLVLGCALFFARHRVLVRRKTTTR